jgi:hypothetical protein
MNSIFPAKRRLSNWRLTVLRLHPKSLANRSSKLDDSTRRELGQFEMVESLIRLFKTRMLTGQARE